MTVIELIDALNNIEDKTLGIRVEIDDNVIEMLSVANYWVTNVLEHSTGDSGYEVEGEVVLIGTE